MLINSLINTIKPNKDGCLNWKWDTSRSGYGRAWISKNKKVTVHRYILAKLLKLDYYDYSWQAMHKCNNKSCVNVDHLIVGNYELNREHLDITHKLLKEEVSKSML